MKSHYPEVTIGSLASPEPGAFKIGPFGSSLKKGELVPEGIPVVGIENVLPNNFVPEYRKFITPEKFEQLSQYKMEPFDVVVTTMGTIGRAAVVPENIGTAIIDSHLFRMRGDQKKVDPAYLCYALNGYAPLIRQLQEKAVGAIMAGLNTKILRECTIPLPPLPEQQRIAAWLNERMAAVTQARRSAEEQLQAARALPLAYFRKVFESEHTKSLPRVRFDEIAILQRGYDLPSQNQIPGRYPIITSSGAKGTHHEFMTRGPGVVTGRSGSIGKVFYVESDYWPHNTALFAKDFKGNEPRYLFYLLQWMDLKTVSSGTGVPTLDRKQVHNVNVPKIDVIDQSRIYKYLDERMQFSEELIAATESQLAEINRLPSALLRRAFAGGSLGHSEESQNP